MSNFVFKFNRCWGFVVHCQCQERFSSSVAVGGKGSSRKCVIIIGQLVSSAAAFQTQQLSNSRSTLNQLPTPQQVVQVVQLIHPESLLPNSQCVLACCLGGPGRMSASLTLGQETYHHNHPAPNLLQINYPPNHYNHLECLRPAIQQLWWFIVLARNHNEINLEGEGGF